MEGGGVGGVEGGGRGGLFTSERQSYCISSKSVRKFKSLPPISFTYSLIMELLNG